MEDLKSWLALAHAPGLHAGQIAEFLAQGHAPPNCLRRRRQRALRSELAKRRSPRCIARIRHASTRTSRGSRAGRNGSLVAWGSPDYPPLLALIPDAPLVLYVEGDPAALSLPQLAIVGSRNPTALGRDTARQFGIASRAGRAGHHERPRARHRRRSASGRARCRRPDDCGGGPRARRDLPARKRRARATHRRAARRAGDRPARRHAPAQAEFPPPQQDPERPGGRNPRGRGRTAERLADHGPARRRTRSRSLCHARLDPQRAGPRLPQTAAPGREAGRNGR